MQPKSDEELQAVTIGKLQPLRGQIVLADYDPTWPQLFENEAANIRSVLNDRALSIEHVGSTAVPGLAAKPIIDIVLTVEDSADEASYLPELEAAGYVLRIREPDWYEHRVFKGPKANINLHVFSAGRSEVNRMLAFRDRLRTDPHDRQCYEHAKRDLARRTWKHVQHYADANTEVIQQILDETRKNHSI